MMDVTRQRERARIGGRDARRRRTAALLLLAGAAVGDGWAQSAAPAEAAGAGRDALEQRLSRLEDERDSYERLTEEFKLRLDGAIRERDELKARVDSLRLELKDAARRIHRLQEDLADVAEQARDIAGERDDAREALAAARIELDRLRERTASQEVLLEQRTRDTRDLRRRLTEGEGNAAAQPGPDFERRLLEARRLIAAGSSAEALEILGDLQTVFPDDPRVRLAQAQGHLVLGNAAAARALAEDLEALDPDDPDAAALLGRIWLLEGNPRKADRYLSRAIKQRPADDRLLVLRAMALHARGKAGAARDALEAALALNETNAEAHFNLAVLLAESDEPDLPAAQAHYREALRLGMAPDAALERALNPGSG